MPPTAGNRARGDRFRRWRRQLAGTLGRVMRVAQASTGLGTCCFALLSWTVAGYAPALAGQLDYGAGLALAHDSNITRGSIIPSCVNPPCAEWTETLFGGIAYAERSVDFTARLLAQVQRRTFLRNAYQDDTLYFANGAAVWTIAPQQLSWAVEDVATQSLLSLTAQDTPANRVNTNALSTGPEFTFRVNPTNMPAIGARYARYDIQGTGDNQRYMGYARWLYRLSEPENLSLNYEVSRVNFTPPALLPNFLRHEQFLRYERLSPPNSLIVEGGTTHIQRYGGEETNGRLASVTTLRTLTSESALRLVLSDQISDSATDLLRGVISAASPTTPTTPTEMAVAVPHTGSNVTTGDVYRSQRGEVTYIAQSGRIGYTLQGYARRVDYTTLDQDYHETGGRLTLTWIQSGAVRIYANADYVKRTIPSLDERDTNRTSTLGVTYRLTPSLFVSAEGGRIERESNVPLQSFLDRRVLLLLGYSTGPLYALSRR